MAISKQKKIGLNKFNKHLLDLDAIGVIDLYFCLMNFAQYANSREFGC